MSADKPQTRQFIDGDSVMARMFRSHDWKAHPLGDPETWPDVLKTTVALMLTSRFPMFIAWGRERYFLYNDGYAPMLGARHPGALGKRFEDIWSDIWADLTPLVEEVDRGGAVYLEDMKLMMLRKGFEEETYFTFSYSPIRDSAGEVCGLFCAVVETTERKKSEADLKRSQERLSLALEAARLGVYERDLRTGKVEWSTQAKQILGHKPGDLEETFESFLKRMNPDDLKRFQSEAMQSVQTGGAVDIDYRFNKPDGEEVWLHAFGKAVLEDGKPVRAIGVLQDITDRKIAALELKVRSDAIENSLAAFDIVDHTGKFIYANRAYVKMWGYDSVREIIGTSPASHCADPSTPIEIITTLKKTGQCDIEFVAKRKDGTTFDVRMLAFLAHDANGNEIYPTTSIDITEQKRARESMKRYTEQLKAAKEDAERANELKSAFLANMSHEIRTPLGAMIGFADLLRDPGLTGVERSNYIDILSRNGQSLGVIINDILDLSKVEAGHLVLEFADVNPEVIATDVVSLLRVKAKEKDLSLNFSVEDSTPDSIVTDGMRVRQILLNLVGNAIKFTQFGSVNIRLFGCKTDEGTDAACIEIKDTGIGIPPSQKEKIFEMFVQADGSMTRRFGGTGLGLALSRRLARELGGNVEITETAEGKGSTFLVKIEDQPSRRNSTATTKKTEKPARELTEDVLKNVRVLVVDDAPDNQQLIWRYLTKYGAIVDSAENGVIGCKKALEGNHDIVLMDIQMPEMDGYTATHKLRAAGFKKPIIALTAHAMSEVRQKSLNVGCTDHLSKPIDMKALISTVAEYTAH